MAEKDKRCVECSTIHPTPEQMHDIEFYEDPDLKARAK